jgi:hypothetical protein
LITAHRQKKMTAKTPPPGSPSSLSAFRRKLRKQPRMAAMLRAGRALIHFGPWRHVARKYISLRRPPASSALPTSSMLPNLDATSVVARLRTESVCVVEALPLALVDEIRELTDRLPPNQYGLFNEQHPAVQRLIQDPGVLAVARGYLRAEPVLLECNLVVQEAEDGRPAGPTSQRRFHFDYAGWHSLNLFVYLTDVEADSGAHQVVAGTHKHKLMRDAIRPSLDDDEVERRFGTKVRTITGAAGTVFFEDTEAFHRRVAVRQRRAMLNILFASHRSAFSRGRLVKPHREMVARIGASTARR